MYSHRSTITATETINQSSIAQRYGVGAIYRKEFSLDGDVFIFQCKSIDSIDGFFMNENSNCLNRSEKHSIDDLIAYQDNLLTRPDLIALDHLLAEMVISGNDCNTYQGVHCG